jgi:hypothetical protein
VGQAGEMTAFYKRFSAQLGKTVVSSARCATFKCFNFSENVTSACVALWAGELPKTETITGGVTSPVLNYFNNSKRNVGQPSYLIVPVGADSNEPHKWQQTSRSRSAERRLSVNRLGREQDEPSAAAFDTGRALC